MNTLSSVNLAKAMFDISDVTEKTDIFEKFPKLNQYIEFRATLPKSLNRAILFRYIVLMYDSMLAVRELIPDLGKRKKECAVFAGFKETDGKFDEHTEMVLLCMSDIVNAMIIAYCQMQRMPRFTSLVAIEEAHQKLLKVLLNEGTDKSAVLKTVNDMEREMEERKLDLLNHDKSFHLYNSLYEATEIERLSLRPEDIAVRLRNGQPAVDVVPYGKKYTLEKYDKQDVKKGREKII